MINFSFLLTSKIRELRGKLINPKSPLPDILTLLVIDIVIFRFWFSTKPTVAGDWSTIISKEWVLSYLHYPSAWIPLNGGSYEITILHKSPILLLYGLFVYLGLDPVLSERIIWFFPLIFGATFSMYYLSYKAFKNRIVSFFASLLYLLNTYVLLETVEGHIWVSYAVIPLIFALVVIAVNKVDIKRVALAALVTSIALAYDVRIGLLSILICLMYFAFAKFTGICILKNILKLLGTYISIIVALSLYYILPAYLAATSLAPSGYNNPGMVMGLGKEQSLLKNLLLVHNPFWFNDVVSYFNIYPMFLIPLLVSIPIIAYYRDKLVIFFSIIALMSIFLIKGANQPFGEVYIWLFQHVPFFEGFREPMKFFPLLLFGFAPLFGLGAEKIIAGAGKLFNRKHIKLFAKFSSMTLILVLLLGGIVPIIENLRFYGNLRPSGVFDTIPPEYYKINSWINNNQGEYRIWFIPDISCVRLGLPEKSLGRGAFGTYYQ